MFGIGGGELIFIILVVLMLFGTDKIPDIARTMGKTMRQLKDATEDIKTEIKKGTEETGISKSLANLRSNIDLEIDKAKENMSVDTSDIEKVKEDIDGITGPIKRNR